MTALAANVFGRGPSGLPAEVTSFVGRRHELAEVKRLLTGSHVVTLTGVGGVGKSRLALRVAMDVRRAFPGGVWLVELAELENPELLTQAVAEALDLEDYSPRPRTEVLLERLAGRSALIVLDNCEHLLTPCAVLVDTFVRALPDLRILATSRQPLGIASEQTVDVAPLPFPAAEGDPIPTDALSDCDAVRLFAERATAVLPDFALTDANREAVTAICRRLDGLPLAIELAAVRLRALSVDQVLERLDDRFRLLTAGSRAALPRQRTLRALIGWSYDLCTEQERLMWQRASVFSGGLDLEAAEDVCSGDGIARHDVLDLVTGLVEKSVLVREEQQGTVRYRLLDTIRHYGRERLAASGQEAALQRRHRDHFRRIAAAAHADRFGPEQAGCLSRLQRENANLRMALEWSYGEPDEVETGLDMACDLLYHWITGRHISEGRRWIDRGLAVHVDPSPTRARALWSDAWLAILQDDPGPAGYVLEEGRHLAERLGLERDLAYVNLFSAQLAMRQGDPETAIKLYEEAAAAHRAHADPVGLVLTLVRLSMARSFRGDAEAAVGLAEEALAVCESHQEDWHRAYALMALGIELRRQGDLRRAAELEKDSLRINRSVNDLFGTGVNLEVLAWIAADERRFQRAARLLGVLDTVWRAVGSALSGFGHLVRYHDECQARAAEVLGEQAFRAAVKRGTRLPYDEAIQYALQEEPPEAEAEGPAPAKGGRLPPLTRRETEIAELVARGLSNKDIASALVISQRTAEGHIEHILDKLGFKSRTQIATWLGERTRRDAS
ncbi:ATP-binding protein [Microbispora sp. ATCC PTA-5024]|uniref:ATP-binding protein n=1 Tax=Microbispora sp. ATCC PTA-5024 TaxID=316330 RepID=UPI0003DD15C2|nr:LuxR C-terminal-related transcriptional regulator [Microbispora sp. ATCC PTA-5024]ETK34717.1 LuxR family transcriptional regulator [Microbispora sp. ATCC PTA-5024]